MNDGYKTKILNVKELMKKNDQRKKKKKQKYSIIDLISFFRLIQTRRAEQEKILNELREKKYKKWLERKDQQAMMVNEFKKLQADEEMASGASSSSIDNINRMNNHRAFQK